MKTLLSSIALAWVNIKGNFFRTILSILGIVIGVASLVGILSLIDGMEKFAREQISKTTSLNAINIHHELYNKINEVRVKKDSAAVLFMDDLTEMKASIKEETEWFIRTSSNGLVTVDSTTIGVTALATLKNIEPDAVLISGEFFRDEQIISGEIPVIVSEAFVSAAKLTQKSALNKSFSFEGKQFKAVGVLKKANERDNALRFFYSIKNLLPSEWRANPPEIYLMVKNVEMVSSVSQSIKDWIGKKFSGNKNDFSINTNEFRVEQTAKAFLLFRLIMGLIVGISVLVGGIGVMNVLLISVTERTREIGIRKAVGANKKHIVMQFLAESITISTIGSFLGFVLGIVGTATVVPIVKAITKVPFQAAYTWNTFLVITVVAIVIGVVFGTYPALRASRLDPVEAIRHE